MRRYELVGRRRIVLRDDVPRPEPESGQVLVRVRSCSVCGRSDLVYYHYLGLREHCRHGHFGHEIAGVVEAVGPGVRQVAPGDRVFVRTPLTSGYADFALAREVAVGRLPEEVPFEQGSILQLLPLAVHATRGVELGDRVLIQGQGPVGLMALQVARLRGASEILVSDLDPWRLERSRELGSDVQLAVAEEPLVRRRDELGSLDVVIDAIGSPSAARGSVDLVRHNGLVVFLGTHHIDTEVTFDLVQWEKKGLRVHSSAEPTDEARARSMRIAERLVAQGRIRLAPLLTHTYPLDQLPLALERLSASLLLYPEGGPSPHDGPPAETLKVSILP
jgi:threonine dehydrogenase-like Zn-dependent dehydrogenase